MAAPLLSVTGLHRSYGRAEVLAGLDLQVDAGRVGLLHPAGEAGQAGLGAQGWRQVLPVEPYGLAAGAFELLGAPRAAAGHALRGHMAGRIGRLVMAQAGEVVPPPAAPTLAGARVFAVGQGRGVGFRGRVDPGIAGLAGGGSRRGSGGGGEGFRG